MFELLTDRARQVVVLAQEEARLLDHDHIGTEHLLLAIVRDAEGPGGAVPALAALPGIGLETVRAQVGELAGTGAGGTSSGHVPFTRRAKKVLELSLREARVLGHGFIDTGHVLLGIVREGEGLAARVLVDLGAGLPAVRDAAVASLATAPGERRPPGSATEWPPGSARGGGGGSEGGGSEGAPARRSEQAPVDARLDAIEQRLGAMEELLRRLVERAGDGGGERA